MKKIIAILLAVFMIAALCACTANTERPAGDGQKTASPGGSSDNTAVPGGDDPTADPGSDPDQGGDGNTPEPVKGSEGLDIREYDENCQVVDIGGFNGTELIIPSHVNGKPVTSVDEDALSNETMISLVIPWTVRSIGEDAVSSSPKLETVTFSEGLLGLGTGAFGGCTALKSVTLPSSLERVGDSCFRDCTALEEVTLLGNSSIGGSSFLGCDALKKVTFAGKTGYAYSLRSACFESDALLEEVAFAEGLEVIGPFSFAGCTSLKTVYLPASLTKVEASAFQNTGELKVFYAGSEEQWNAIEIANGNDMLKNADITFNFGK